MKNLNTLNMEINEDFMEKFNSLMAQYEAVIQREKEKSSAQASSSWLDLIPTIFFWFIALLAIFYIGSLIFFVYNYIRLKLQFTDQQREKINQFFTYTEEISAEVKEDLSAAVCNIVNCVVEIKELIFLVVPIVYAWIKDLSFKRVSEFFSFNFDETEAAQQIDDDWELNEENLQKVVSNVLDGKLAIYKTEMTEMIKSMHERVIEDHQYNHNECKKILSLCSKQLEEIRIAQIDKLAIDEKLEHGIKQMDIIAELFKTCQHEDDLKALKKEMKITKSNIKLTELDGAAREQIMIKHMRAINTDETKILNIKLQYPNAWAKIHESASEYEKFTFVPTELEIAFFLLTNSSTTILPYIQSHLERYLSDEKIEKFKKNSAIISEYVLCVIWEINGKKRPGK